MKYSFCPSFSTSLYASFAVFLEVFPASFGDLSFGLSGSFAEIKRVFRRLSSGFRGVFRSHMPPIWHFG